MYLCSQPLPSSAATGDCLCVCSTCQQFHFCILFCTFSLNQASVQQCTLLLVQQIPLIYFFQHAIRKISRALKLRANSGSTKQDGKRLQRTSETSHTHKKANHHISHLDFVSSLSCTAKLCVKSCVRMLWSFSSPIFFSWIHFNQVLDLAYHRTGYQVTSDLYVA